MHLHNSASVYSFQHKELLRESFNRAAGISLWPPLAERFEAPKCVERRLKTLRETQTNSD